MQFRRNYNHNYWLALAAAHAFEALVVLFTAGRCYSTFLDEVLCKRIDWHRDPLKKN